MVHSREMLLTGYIEYLVFETVLEFSWECSETCVLQDKRLLDVSRGKSYIESAYLAKNFFDIRQYLPQCFRPFSGDIVTTR